MVLGAHVGSADISASFLDRVDLGFNSLEDALQGLRRGLACGADIAVHVPGDGAPYALGDLLGVRRGRRGLLFGEPDVKPLDLGLSGLKLRAIGPAGEVV